MGDPSSALYIRCRIVRCDFTGLNAWASSPAWRITLPATQGRRRPLGCNQRALPPRPITSFLRPPPRLLLLPQPLDRSPFRLHHRPGLARTPPPLARISSRRMASPSSDSSPKKRPQLSITKIRGDNTICCGKNRTAISPDQKSRPPSPRLASPPNGGAAVFQVVHVNAPAPPPLTAIGPISGQRCQLPPPRQLPISRGPPRPPLPRPLVPHLRPNLEENSGTKARSHHLLRTTIFFVQNQPQTAPFSPQNRPETPYLTHEFASNSPHSH